MNIHIYVDKEEPAVSAIQETLSDGSHVWNLIIRAKELGCRNEADAKQAAISIAATLQRFTLAEVLTV